MKFLSCGVVAAWPVACLLVFGLLGGCGGPSRQGPDQFSPDQFSPAQFREDHDYLLRLGLIRGHLAVGVALYRNGHKAAAAGHMKHPADELYSDLIPEFSARGVQGFAQELAMLSAAVTGGQPPEEVCHLHSQLLTAIRKTATAARPGDANRMRVATSLVEEAAKEYAEAIAGNRIVKPHEYQDAYGFVRIARVELNSLAKISDPVLSGKVKRMRKHLKKLAPAWPELMPPTAPTLSVARFHEIARKVAAEAR